MISSCRSLKTKDASLLVWSDEFNYNGYPDESKWSYDLGDGCPGLCNWGNGELQYYTNTLKNAKVENGKLIITAIKENIFSYQYSSARLVSKHKGDWKYGRIEVKANLPSGYGTWPAIWMLPTNKEYGGWPASGEIDIMEHVGFVPDTIYGTVHTKSYTNSTQKPMSRGIMVSDCENEMHIYSIDWTEKQIIFKVDNQPYFTFTNEGKSINEWPFDTKFHLLLNMAVGGHWGGAKGVNNTIFPQSMEVDYVRVYK